MTSVDQYPPEPTGDDLAAAEYVLGVLPAEARQAVQRRINAEPDFARLVEHWEARLAPLADDYHAVDAPVAVKAALDRRLFSGRVQPASAPGLWRSLPFWRSLAAAAVVALVVAIAVPFLRPPAEAPALQLVASLAAEGSDVTYLAVYDAASNRVGLSHVSGERAPGRDFELWLIGGNEPPVSLGVIPAGATVEVTVAADAADKPAAGTVLAISLEPEGGSPTGQPTGPVVAAGDLKEI